MSEIRPNNMRCVRARSAALLGRWLRTIDPQLNGRSHTNVAFCSQQSIFSLATPVSSPGDALGPRSSRRIEWRHQVFCSPKRRCKCRKLSSTILKRGPNLPYVSKGKQRPMIALDEQGRSIIHIEDADAGKRARAMGHGHRFRRIP
jgi:hypothetical protein